MADTEKKTTKTKAKKADNEAEKANALCHDIDMLVKQTMRSKQVVEG